MNEYYYDLPFKLLSSRLQEYSYECNIEPEDVRRAQSH